MKQLLFALFLAGPVVAQTALPFDVGGPFALTDQNGAPRTQENPAGHPQLLFFGYANCPGICTAALPLMADVVDNLADQGITISPVMITVDPARDTIENMHEPLANYHPAIVGLTGSAAELDVAYKAFSVDHKLAYDDPEYGPVYTHGSLIYLLDAGGDVLTLIPPVLDAEKATEVALKYVDIQ
jgi:protein SCO1/2